MVLPPTDIDIYINPAFFVCVFIAMLLCLPPFGQYPLGILSEGECE